MACDDQDVVEVTPRTKVRWPADDERSSHLGHRRLRVVSRRRHWSPHPPGVCPSGERSGAHGVATPDRKPGGIRRDALVLE